MGRDPGIVPRDPVLAGNLLDGPPLEVHAPEHGRVRWSQRREDVVKTLVGSEVCTRGDRSSAGGDSLLQGTAICGAVALVVGHDVRCRRKNCTTLGPGWELIFSEPFAALFSGLRFPNLTWEGRRSGDAVEVGVEGVGVSLRCSREVRQIRGSPRRPASRLPVGINVPHTLYWLLGCPAPLAGMKYPQGIPWTNLYELGGGHIVCLTDDTPHYDPTPLQVLCAVQLEDLVHGGAPRNPPKAKERIRQAVNAIGDALQAGEGVLVHCAGGRGRTGTVIGCTLRALGVPAQHVVEHLRRVHEARGRGGWPESPWQAEIVTDFDL